MVTKVDIYNLALSHLGITAITSLTEDTPSVRAGNQFYEPSRDAVFSDFKWPFANVSEALVGVDDAVLELEWAYVYVYPTQAAAVWNVYNESTIKTKENEEFEVVFQVANNRKVIASNNATAYAEYTYKVIDTTIYSPNFVILLSLRLASSMAHTLIADVEVGNELLLTYGNALAEARRLSYSERKKKPTQVSAYQQSR